MKLSKRSIRAIMRQYGLHVRRIRPCASLYRRTAAYKVSTDQRSVFLKPFKGSRERLAHMYRFYRRLRRKRFAHIPRWLLTRRRKPWLVQNGRLFYLTEWIDGAGIEDVVHYEKLGEVLGHLHRITYRPESGRSSTTKREIRRFKLQHIWFARCLPRIQEQNGVAGYWFRKFGDQCLEMAYEAWDMLRQPRVDRLLRSEIPVAVHGDVTLANVFVSRDKIILVDWEFTRYGSSYYELAKTLTNICNYNETYIQALLAGYERSRPFMSEERTLIAAFFRMPREVWIAAGVYRSFKRSIAIDQLAFTWPDRLNAIRWIDKWAST